MLDTRAVPHPITLPVACIIRVGVAHALVPRGALAFAAEICFFVARVVGAVHVVDVGVAGGVHLVQIYRHLDVNRAAQP